MKKFTLLAALLLAMSAGAAPVERSKAQNAAKSAIQCLEMASGRGTKADAPWHFADMSRQAGVEEVYLFNYTHGDRQGFVIVSRDDLATPILALSDEGQYDPDNANPAFRWWVGQYGRQITQGRAQGLTPAPAVRQQWEEMCSGKAVELAARRAAKTDIFDSVYIPHLLGAKIWNQTDPYNRLCPAVGGKRAVTGCVATAFSMIMSYWKWPEHGFGHHSYNGADNPAAYGTWPYGEVSADFEHTYYDWDHMGDYASINSPDSLWRPIATLCHQVGVAFDMNYSPNGSGCWSLREYAIFDTTLHLDSTVGAEYRIPKHFGYKYTYAGMRDSVHSDSLWNRMLFQSIIDSMPIYYAGWAADESEAGHSGTSGHGFIIDGCYAEPGYDRMYHLNWGWGGSQNGLFLLDALNPGSDFTQWHGAVIGMQPDSSYHGYEAIRTAEQPRTPANIFSEGGRLVIEGVAGELVSVFDVTGRRVGLRSASSGDRYSLVLRPGVYLVRVGATTQKAVHF